MIDALIAGRMYGTASEREDRNGKPRKLIFDLNQKNQDSVLGAPEVLVSLSKSMNRQTECG